MSRWETNNTKEERLGEERRLAADTIQANKEMTNDSNYHSHYEKSSQLSSENPTKDLAYLTRRRNGLRLEH